MVAYKGRSKDIMAKERMEREQIELEKAVGFSAILKKIRNSVNLLNNLIVNFYLQYNMFWFQE